MKDGRTRQSALGTEERIWDSLHPGRRSPTTAVFTPDIVKAMGDGFDRAWTAIVAANLACATDHSGIDSRLRLAHAIVEAARLGTRDCNRLSASALRSVLPLGLEGENGLDRNEV